MEVEGIDHIIICVHSVDHGREIFAQLGFEMTPDGNHLALKSKNSLAMLDGTYLEVTAPTAPEAFGLRLKTHLQAWGEGFFGLAMRHSDVDAFAQEPARDWVEAERAVETELLQGIAKFRLCWLPENTITGASCFLVQHLTPDMLWHPQLQRHPNQAHTIETLYLRSDAPFEAAAKLRRALKLPHASDSTVVMPRNCVSFLSSAEMAARWGDTATAAIDIISGAAPAMHALFGGRLIMNFKSAES